MAFRQFLQAAAEHAENKSYNPLIYKIQSKYFIMMHGRDSSKKQHLLEQAIEAEFCWVPDGVTPVCYSMYCDRIHAIALKTRRGIVPGARAMQNLNRLRPGKDHSQLPQWIQEALEFIKK